MSLGEGFEVAFRGGGAGGVFLLKTKEKLVKGLGRWGGGLERYRQVNAHAFVKSTL